MKLLTKTTLWFLAISIVVFGFGGIAAYNLISDEISKETDYYLGTILDRIERRLEYLIDNDREVQFSSNRVMVKEVIGQDLAEPSFRDTLAMHPHLNQMETMRKLTAVTEVKGRTFRVEVTDVIVEKDDIYESVVQIITRLFALLAFCLVIGGLLMSRILMRPFRQTLAEIDAFDVQSTSPISLPNSRTSEFAQLHRFLQRMTGRAQREYQALKKFSENASHELQTPLAVAKGKLEMLLNAGPLSEDQYKSLASAQEALNRISLLGKSLALLTKIDNEEFDATEETDLSQLVERGLSDFQELFSLKKLKLESRVTPGVQIELNKHLGEMLLTNLLQNTIKHNFEGGDVLVELDPSALKISNSGPTPMRPTGEMFERFAKDNGHPDSNGLGLAIVKEICDYHDFNLSYDFDGHHHISIQFPN